MTFKAEIAKGLKWQLITLAARQLLSLMVFTTLARLLDPSAFGLVALVAVYNYFASMLADLGLGVALIQKQELEPEHINTLFWFNVTCNAILCILTIIFATPLSILFGEEQLVPLLRWSSIGLLINAFSSVQNNLFIKSMDFRRPGIRNLIANLSGGLIGILMAVAGFGVWALVGQSIVSTLAGTLFIFLSSDFRPRLAFSLRHLRDLLGVGSSVFANAIVWFFSSRLDQLVIGRLAGVPTLGLYVVGNKVPDMLRTFTHQPLTEVTVPALAKLQNDHARMRGTIYKGMEITSLVLFAIFVGLSSVSRQLIPILFGSKWNAAGSICALLSLYTLVNSLQVFFYPALLASGVTIKYLFLNIIQTMGVFIVCFFGIHLGIKYLIIGLILNSLVMFIPSLLFLKRQIGLRPIDYCRPFLVPALSAAIMYTVCIFLEREIPSGVPQIASLVFRVVVGAVIYCCMVFLLKRSLFFRLFETIKSSISNRALGT